MSKKLYDNCRALHPNGEHMFFCSLKKARSYLSKDLAVLISEDPYVFKLTFEPNGMGSPEDQFKENMCIACKTEENLTKHHVIPYAIRRNFTAEYKDHRSEEVVPLCRTCHSAYELTADKYKKELFTIIESDLEDQKIELIAKKALKTLENHEFFMDEEKKTILQAQAKLYTGKEPKSAEVLLTEKMEPSMLCDVWNAHFSKWLESEHVRHSS